MSLNRFDARRDENEKQIVDYIRVRGLSVERLNTPLDLLIGYDKRNFLVEIKMPGKALNKKQEKFVSEWKGQAVIISSIEQAQIFCDGVKLLKQS